MHGDERLFVHMKNAWGVCVCVCAILPNMKDPVTTKSKHHCMVLDLTTIPSDAEDLGDQEQQQAQETKARNDIVLVAQSGSLPFLGVGTCVASSSSSSSSAFDFTTAAIVGNASSSTPLSLSDTWAIRRRLNGFMGTGQTSPGILLAGDLTYHQEVDLVSDEMFEEVLEQYVNQIKTYARQLRDGQGHFFDIRGNNNPASRLNT